MHRNPPWEIFDEFWTLVGPLIPTSHAKFQQWERAGFFQALWRHGLAEYDDLAGIAWEWQAADGINIEAPLAQESSMAILSSGVSLANSWR